MNDITKDYMEKWQAQIKEMNAKADKLNAEARLKYNDAIKNFSEEMSAAGDWMAADWDQFNARVKKWWNELEISIKE